MKALSQTVGSIQRSPIRVMLDSAARFSDALHLEIGQPDFDTPAHIVDAAVRAAKAGYTAYTANAGIAELRDAVCTKLARENGYAATRANVMITVGAMQAVYLSMHVLLEPGDEILLPDPGYGNFGMATTLLHAVPVAYPTPPERDFCPDVDALERLVTPRTKALLLNSPCNPTGAVFPREVLRECLAFCRRHDLYLISDETYDRLVFEGEHYSPAQWDDEGRVVSIYTCSKTYSMTGWRVGYAVANPAVITAMSKIQEPIASCVNTIAQHAAIAALLGPQDCVQQMRDEYRRRRDIAVAVAREQGLHGSYPHGAFYMLIDIGAQPLSSLDYCQNLLEAEHVAVGPGCAFGPACDRYVRISLCASEEALREGIARLGRHLNASADAGSATCVAQAAA